MELKATAFALEDRPISVAFGNMPTLGALLRGISGIDKANRDALGQSLVFHKALEHGKPPAMDLSVALPSKVGPAPNVGQLFKDQNGTVIGCGFIHQPLADLVQCVPVEAVFPTAKPLKNSLSTSGAFALKGTPHSEVVVSAPVKSSCLEEFIGAGDSDILHSQVDPNNLAGGSRRGNKFFKDKVQKEGLVLINKVRRTKLPGFITQIAPLEVSESKITPHPVSVGRKCAVIRFDSAGSSIVADRSKSEMWFRAISLKTRLHRLSDLITARASKVRRELKFLSREIVNLVVKGDFVGKPLLPSNITNPITGIGVGTHCLKEKTTILRQKLYPNRSSYLLHIHILLQYRVLVKRRRYAPIPPRLERRGFLGAIL